MNPATAHAVWRMWNIVWIRWGLTTVMKVDKTKEYKIRRAVLRTYFWVRWKETVGGGRRWYAYLIIVCASLSITCQRHTPASSLSIAPNARASIVLSSLYLSTSYNCLWQGSIPVSTAPYSTTPSSWNRGRIRRREWWWRCLCLFTTYHCRSRTTAYFSVAFHFCPCSIPRTYFRPMGSSIPNISSSCCSCSSPSTRYPRYTVPNTSTPTSVYQFFNTSPFSLNRFTSKYRNDWSRFLSLEEVGNSCFL